MPLKKFFLAAVLLMSVGLLVSAQTPGADPKKEVTNSIGMKLVYIKPGTFTMGSPADETGRFDNEGPQHEVKITKGFYLGACPVTQAQYVQLINRNPSWFRDGGPGQEFVEGMNTDDFPVDYRNFVDAIDFCKKLTQKEGKTYRLPTEAEWEYACRAGTKTAFYFGDKLSSKQANFNGNFPYGGADRGASLARTTKVDAYPPNEWGLYDMHGNVMTWCQDFYDENYYKNSPKEDPKGPAKGGPHVLRGGTWSSYAAYTRSAFRSNYNPDVRNYGVGLRVVLVAP